MKTTHRFIFFPQNRDNQSTRTIIFILTGIFLAVTMSQFGSDQLRTKRVLPSSPFTKAAAISKMPEDGPPKGCAGFFNCRVPAELNRIHTFLYANKNAAGYTPETRNMQPPQEMVRLLIDTQAHGYLNMYKLTRNKVHLKEAQSRLDAIVAMGDSALRHSPFDGMLAYTLYTGYEQTGKQAYYTLANQIANECLTYQNNVMNWGLMCAMAYGKAYKLTGNQMWADASRAVVANTKPFQYRDGSFPHIENLEADTGYSMWMTEELLEIRKNDPWDPRLSPMLLRTIDFLKRRVNTDGTINYDDQYGRYYENNDSRGWADHLASLATVMRAAGENEKSQKLLERLFGLVDAGLPYPDKSAFHNPNNPMGNDPKSEVRTSLVFWYLSYLALMNNQQCVSGQVQSCTQWTLTNEQYCVAGQLTPCGHVDFVEYRYESACWGEDKVCMDAHCFQYCSTPGYRHCLAGNCSGCTTTLQTQCGGAQCDYQDFCSEGGNPVPSEQAVANTLAD